MGPLDEGMEELGHGVVGCVGEVRLDVGDEFHGGEIDGADGKDSASDGGNDTQQGGEHFSFTEAEGDSEGNGATFWGRVQERGFLRGSNPKPTLGGLLDLLAHP
jgi:hypothetical protein